MEAHNLLFWASLATGVLALGGIAVARIARPSPKENDHPAADLPLDTE